MCNSPGRTCYQKSAEEARTKKGRLDEALHPYKINTACIETTRSNPIESSTVSKHRQACPITVTCGRMRRNCIAKGANGEAAKGRGK
eukprot:3251713-Pyramimonas_sp.AAC.1